MEPGDGRVRWRGCSQTLPVAADMAPQRALASLGGRWAKRFCSQLLFLSIFVVGFFFPFFFPLTLHFLALFQKSLPGAEPYRRHFSTETAAVSDTADPGQPPTAPPSPPQPSQPGGGSPRRGGSGGGGGEGGPGRAGPASRMLAAGSDMAAPSAALRQRRAAAGDGTRGAPERVVAGPAGSGVGSPPSPGTFWLTRIVLLRSIALLYCESPGAGCPAPLSLSAARGAGGGPGRAPGLTVGRPGSSPRRTPWSPGVAPSHPSWPFPAAKPQVGQAGALPRGRGEPQPPRVGARPPVGSVLVLVCEVPPWWERRPLTVLVLCGEFRFAGQGAEGCFAPAPGGCGVFCPSSWVQTPSRPGRAAAVALRNPACLLPEDCFILAAGGTWLRTQRLRGRGRCKMGSAFCFRLSLCWWDGDPGVGSWDGVGWCWGSRVGGAGRRGCSHHEAGTCQQSWLRPVLFLQGGCCELTV